MAVLDTNVVAFLTEASFDTGKVAIAEVCGLRWLCRARARRACVWNVGVDDWHREVAVVRHVEHDGQTNAGRLGRRNDGMVAELRVNGTRGGIWCACALLY